MYELMKEFKNVYIMELPNSQREDSLELWTKSVDRLIDEDAEDIYKAIAERYLAIGCSVMTPDNNRIELMGRLLEEYNIEGVVEMTLQACHTYNIEAKSIEKFVKSKGLPYIHVETDYSQADIGQLDTRIAAFLEMI